MSTRGRGEGFYRELLAEQESSGKSLRAFAAERGLSVWTLYGWRSRLAGSRRRRPRRPDSPRSGFVAVDLVGSSPAGNEIEVQLSDGVRVRVPRDVTTERLVELVRGLRSC